MSLVEVRVWHRIYKTRYLGTFRIIRRQRTEMSVFAIVSSGVKYCVR